MKLPGKDASPTDLVLLHRKWLWALWAVAAAFGCYFCMYFFRKPFTAGAYAETTLWGVDFKTVLVTSQVAGYLLSKFLGIKIIAELPPHRRAAMLLVLILLAEGTLVLFGLVPRPWNAACLFLNGLSLGLVFGLVLGTLEGRRLTEALAAGLCASFILADGITKSIGTWLLGLGFSENWMPSAAGALFLLPFGVCVFMLSRIPPPTRPDVSARTERCTMSRAQRWGFLRRYAGVMIPLVIMYLVVTIIRSIRADFAPEIWRGLGSAAAPKTFSQSEIWVTLGVLVVNGGAVLIVNNRRAFLASLATCCLGLALLTVALLAQRGGLVSNFNFMVLLGLGLYLPYVAMHTTVFERLLASTRDRGNVGFLIYLADSVGYLGYVMVMVARNFGPAPDNLLGLLTTACWVAIGVSALCLLQSGYYFWRLKFGEASVEAAERLA